MARPRKDEQIDIRTEAVAAVVRLLDDGSVAGPEDITLAQVAAAIGCRAPALYSHFHNRDDLLRRAHDAGFAMLYADKQMVAAASVGQPGLGRLRAGGIAYMRFALAHPGLYRLMFAPPPLAAVVGNPFERDIGRRCLEFLSASVVVCQREGRLTGFDAERLAFVLWSAVHGAASLILQNRTPLAGSRPASDEAAAILAVDTIMDLLAATTVAPPLRR